MGTEQYLSSTLFLREPGSVELDRSTPASRMGDAVVIDALVSGSASSAPSTSIAAAEASEARLPKIEYDGQEARYADSDEVRRVGTPSSWRNKHESTTGTGIAVAVASTTASASAAAVPDRAAQLKVVSSGQTDQRNGHDAEASMSVRNNGNAEPQIQRKAHRIAPSRSAFLSPSFQFPKDSELALLREPITGRPQHGHPALSPEPPSSASSSVVESSTKSRSTSPPSRSQLANRPHPQPSPSAAIQTPDPPVDMPTIRPQASSSSTTRPTSTGNDMRAVRRDNEEAGAPCAFPRNYGQGFSIQLRSAQAEDGSGPADAAGPSSSSPVGSPKRKNHHMVETHKSVLEAARTESNPTNRLVSLSLA